MTKIPKWWTETTLGEIAEISSSKRIFANEYKNEWVPFFRWKEITEKFLWNKISTELFITEEKYNEIKNNYWVPQENDLLLTSVWTLWNPYLVERNYKFYFKDGNITWFHDYNWIFYKYLFYRICSSLGKESLSHAQIWSTQQAYTIVALKKCSILLPPLPEQKAIAGVLSAFDDKIELLKAENQTLEEMGQTLFKEWFGKYKVGDNLPDGWKIGKLGDIVSINKRWITPEYNYNKDIMVISQKSIRNSIIDLNEVYWHDKNKKYDEELNLQFMDTLINSMWTWTLGRISPYILHQPATLHSCVTLLRSNNKSNPYYLYLLVKSLENIITDMWTWSTGQTSLKNSDLWNLEIIIPSKTVMDNFEEIIKPLYKKISINLEEIQSLSNTRDQLLPKLMSWEVRV